MLKVGLTGGIGSGKSVVAKMIGLLGIPVYNADVSARHLTETNGDIREGLLKQFGGAVLMPDGSINRKFIASRVFSNPEELEKLNALIHPAVQKDYNDWHNRQSAPYTLREAAILFEAGLTKDLDVTILVDAPEQMRILRVLKRDQRPEEEIRAIIARQWPSKKKRALADYIIDNDDQQLVIPQVLSVHAKLCADAG